ncbi:MAG: hypothetical protein JW801_09230 [Bacteroidales bacterium]|nr:hypothetical protein [Bacteroidales bacterium]
MNRLILMFVVFIYGLSSCQKEPLRTEHKLPVLSLTIDEKYLWSPDSGLLVIGENGAPGSG